MICVVCIREGIVGEMVNNEWVCKECFDKMKW